MSFQPHQGQQVPGNAASFYQSAQPLGSNTQRMSTGSTPVRQDPFLTSTSNHAAAQRPPSLMQSQQGSNAGAPLSAPPSVVPQGAHGFETPRRAYGDVGQGTNPYTPSSAQQARYPQQDNTPGQAPNIHLQQATPQSSTFPPLSPSGVPDTLQAGGAGRPGPSSAYTAPTTVPTMPQVNSQQYAPPSRSAILGSSHSHSRSSPAGLDQKYMPFSGTPSATPSSGSKLFNPQTPTGSSAFSPLGLSDIRPRADSDLQNSGSGTNVIFDESGPTNSSYLAPWPTYAYDWCKWPVQHGSGCGKMAIGSYLEDPHNFVCWQTR